ncbi:hypothetical protein TBLA_0E03790 [Henningerozyma blattae CBS 6284]|uniref:Major facilitator superfamily (MFS) profile domain-containing protein n=1 Tax=Henningerozyma blattae (strain ATCC 34711 / CBS 6284 / DSM 70876 / NBRC 10599 / NRRL Y-10934 / UCD 77-7) TaxID=1071380 RepID=I2H4Y1_HENB6|nr:hypothetical protein TBLA_0E03790 [Tetrapisispora blattae CBS 6284]CCH61433.1 hypothetical protein TBLA_0E03790 [Tetrapisispora blattae CBS 6284]
MLVNILNKQNDDTTKQQNTTNTIANLKVSSQLDFDESDQVTYNPVSFEKDSIEIPTDDDDDEEGNHHDTTNGMYKTKSQNRDEPDIDSPPYSWFDKKEKAFLVVQCAFTGLLSSLAGSIYYPVLSVLEVKFHITEEQINISVVVYYVFQAVSPTLMGGLADSLGRRPVIITSVFLYFCACIGLACCNNYSQLIGLRCLQATGISPVIAVNSGLMGDVTTKAERGGYMGLVSGTQVLGTAFGALIGAALFSRWGWRSIFWFLVIGSGVCLVLSLFILPETKRTVVGNGSITPKSYLNKSPLLAIPYYRRKLHLNSPDYSTLEKGTKVSLWAPFTVMKQWDISLILLVAGIQFATWTTHQTALTTALAKDYHFSVVIIGVCFLPSGICTMVSVLLTGRYLNWLYNRKLNKHKIWYEKQRQLLLSENNNDEKLVYDIMHRDSTYVFNLYSARLQPAFVTLFGSCAGFCAFGWCIDVHAPVAAVLCMSGFGSLFANCVLTMSTTLMVDLFPSKASTATGCLNLFRCALSAIFIACLTRMVNHMSYGGVFPFYQG